MNTLGMITIVVDDYDVAIKHYVKDLGFTLIEDTALSPEKRWVVVAPSNEGTKILLAKAANEAQTAAIGNSTGGRVGFFMYTNKFNERIILTDYEYISLKEAIFNYIEMTAYKNGKTKLIIDIHNNMERYEYELKDIGFIKTDRRCLDNSFWYEAEKILKND